MPAALAALGPHEVLKLGDLFVEAIDVLVKEPMEKQYQPGGGGILSQCLSHMDITGRDGRTDILARVMLSQTVRPEGPAGAVQPLELALAQSLKSRAGKR